MDSQRSAYKPDKKWQDTTIGYLAIVIFSLPEFIVPPLSHGNLFAIPHLYTTSLSVSAISMLMVVPSMVVAIVVVPIVAALVVQKSH